MDSLQELLQMRKREEPPEIAAIKQYVHSHFNENVSVSIKGNSITIIAKSAALASSLRMDTVALAEAAQTSKRLFFRIG